MHSLILGSSQEPCGEIGLPRVYLECDGFDDEDSLKENAGQSGGGQPVSNKGQSMSRNPTTLNRLEDSCHSGRTSSKSDLSLLLTRTR